MTAAVSTRETTKKLAALGFTKLPPPPFKKWLIPAIDTILTSDLTLMPT